MSYFIRVDGQVYEIPDDVDPAFAARTIRARNPENRVASDDIGNLSLQLQSGLGAMQENLGGLFNLIGSPFGASTAGQGAVESGQRMQEEARARYSPELASALAQEDPNPDDLIPNITDPRQAVNALIESAPSMVATLGPAAGLRALGAAPRVAAGVSSGIEGGLMAGGSEAAIQQQIRDFAASDPEGFLASEPGQYALAIARERGMLEDPNVGDFLVETAARRAAGLTPVGVGVAGSIIGGLGGERIVGGLPFARQAGARAMQAVPQAVRPIVGQAGAEATEEMLQSGIESLALNAAVQQVDLSRPLTRGLADAVALGGIAGGIGGGTFGAVDALSQLRRPQTPTAPLALPAPTRPRPAFTSEDDLSGDAFPQTPPPPPPPSRPAVQPAARQGQQDPITTALRGYEVDLQQGVTDFSSYGDLVASAISSIDGQRLPPELKQEALAALEPTDPNDPDSFDPELFLRRDGRPSLLERLAPYRVGAAPQQSAPEPPQAQEVEPEPTAEPEPDLEAENAATIARLLEEYSDLSQDDFELAGRYAIENNVSLEDVLARVRSFRAEQQQEEPQPESQAAEVAAEPVINRPNPPASEPRIAEPRAAAPAPQADPIPQEEIQTLSDLQDAANADNAPPGAMEAYQAALQSYGPDRIRATLDPIIERDRPARSPSFEQQVLSDARADLRRLQPKSQPKAEARPAPQPKPRARDSQPQAQVIQPVQEPERRPEAPPAIRRAMEDFRGVAGQSPALRRDAAINLLNAAQQAGLPVGDNRDSIQARAQRIADVAIPAKYRGYDKKGVTLPENLVGRPAERPVRQEAPSAPEAQLTDLGLTPEEAQTVLTGDRKAVDAVLSAKPKAVRDRARSLAREEQATVEDPVNAEEEANRLSLKAGRLRQPFTEDLGYARASYNPKTGYLIEAKPSDMDADAPSLATELRALAGDTRVRFVPKTRWKEEPARQAAQEEPAQIEASQEAEPETEPETVTQEETPTPETPVAPEVTAEEPAQAADAPEQEQEAAPAEEASPNAEVSAAAEKDATQDETDQEEAEAIAAATVEAADLERRQSDMDDPTLENIAQDLTNAGANRSEFEGVLNFLRGQDPSLNDLVAIAQAYDPELKRKRSKEDMLAAIMGSFEAKHDALVQARQEQNPMVGVDAVAANIAAIPYIDQLQNRGDKSGPEVVDDIERDLRQRVIDGNMTHAQARAVLGELQVQAELPPGARAALSGAVSDFIDNPPKREGGAPLFMASDVPQGLSAVEVFEWRQARAKGLDMSREGRLERARSARWRVNEPLLNAAQYPIVGGEFDVRFQGTRTAGVGPGETREIDERAFWFAPLNGRQTRVLEIGFREEEDLEPNALVNRYAEMGRDPRPGWLKEADQRAIERFGEDIWPKSDHPRWKEWQEIHQQETEKVLSEQPFNEPVIYPVYVRGKFKQINQEIDWREQSLEVSNEEETRVARILNDARRDGFDGVIFKRMIDNTGIIGEQWAVFDPRNIRSINAAFDPDFKDQPGLLFMAAGPSNYETPAQSLARQFSREYIRRNPNAEAREEVVIEGDGEQLGVRTFTPQEMVRRAALNAAKNLSKIDNLSPFLKEPKLKRGETQDTVDPLIEWRDAFTGKRMSGDYRAYQRTRTLQMYNRIVQDLDGVGRAELIADLQREVAEGRLGREAASEAIALASEPPAPVFDADGNLARGAPIWKDIYVDVRDDAIGRDIARRMRARLDAMNMQDVPVSIWTGAMPDPRSGEVLPKAVEAYYYNRSIALSTTGINFDAPMQDVEERVAYRLNGEVLHALIDAGVVKQEELDLVNKATIEYGFRRDSKGDIVGIRKVKNPKDSILAEIYRNPTYKAQMAAIGGPGAAIPILAQEEAATLAFREWWRLRSIDKPISFTPPVQRFMRKLGGWVKAVVSAFKGAKTSPQKAFSNADEFFEAVVNGEIGLRDRDQARGDQMSAERVARPMFMASPDAPSGADQTATSGQSFRMESGFVNGALRSAVRTKNRLPFIKADKKTIQSELSINQEEYDVLELDTFLRSAPVDPKGRVKMDDLVQWMSERQYDVSTQVGSINKAATKEANAAFWETYDAARRTLNRAIADDPENSVSHYAAQLATVSEAEQALNRAREESYRASGRVKSNWHDHTPFSEDQIDDYIEGSVAFKVGAPYQTQFKGHDFPEGTFGFYQAVIRTRENGEREMVITTVQSDYFDRSNKSAVKSESERGKVKDLKEEQDGLLAEMAAMEGQLTAGDPRWERYNFALSRTFEIDQEVARLTQGRNIGEVPFAKSYNKVILKAALDEAARQGVQHVVIVDRETIKSMQGMETYSGKLYDYSDDAGPQTGALTSTLRKLIGNVEGQPYKAPGKAKRGTTGMSFPLTAERKDDILENGLTLFMAQNPTVPPATAKRLFQRPKILPGQELAGRSAVEEVIELANKMKDPFDVSQASKRLAGKMVDQSDKLIESDHALLRGLGNLLDNLFTLGNLPAQNMYIALRARTAGIIQRAQEYSDTLAVLRRKMSEDDLTQFRDYMITRNADANLIQNEDVRQAAIATKEIFNLLGVENTRIGRMTKAQHEKYKDRYLPRAYWKFIEKELRGVGIRVGSEGYLRQRGSNDDKLVGLAIEQVGLADSVETMRREVTDMMTGSSDEAWKNLETYFKTGLDADLMNVSMAGSQMPPAMADRFREIRKELQGTQNKINAERFFTLKPVFHKKNPTTGKKWANKSEMYRFGPKAFEERFGEQYVAAMFSKAAKNGQSIGRIYEQGAIDGVITDPILLSIKGVSEQVRSLAVYKFFDQIFEAQAAVEQMDIAAGKDPRKLDWVRPGSLIRFRGQLYGRDAFEEMLDSVKKHQPFYAPGTLKRTHADEMVMEMEALWQASEAALASGGRSSRQYERLPDTKDYGNLRGVQVHRAIHKDLQGSLGMRNYGEGGALIEFEDKQARNILSFFKQSKTTLNFFGGHVRALLGNMANAYMIGGVGNVALGTGAIAASAPVMGGVSVIMAPTVAVMPAYIQALREIRANSDEWQEALSLGVKQGTFTEIELRNSLEVLAEIRDQDLQDPSVVMKAINKLARGASAVLTTAAEVYNFWDTTTRYMVYREAMKKGMPQVDAMNFAYESNPDYSLVPDWVRAIRNNPLGVFAAPFATWAYKMTPTMLDSAARAGGYLKRREIQALVGMALRTAPFFMLVGGVAQLISYALLGFDNEEEQKAYEATYVEGYRDNVTRVDIPARDSQNNYLSTTLDWLFAWNGPVQGVEHLSNGDILKSASSFIGYGNPLLSAGIGAVSGTDTFSGQRLFDEAATDAEKNAARLNYIANSLFLPPGLVGILEPIFEAAGYPVRSPYQGWVSMGADKIGGDGISNSMKYIGDWSAITGRALGFNIVNHDPQRRSQSEYDADERNVNNIERMQNARERTRDRRIQEIMRRPDISQRQKERLAEEERRSAMRDLQRLRERELEAFREQGEGAQIRSNLQ